MARSKNLQFVLYRGATEAYYCFYQNADGTFSCVSHDGNGKCSHVSFLKLTQVASIIFEAATLGFKIADLKSIPASTVTKLHEEIAKGGF